eukprot:4817427-Alexandrium_andersonii.AAC.1
MGKVEKSFRTSHPLALAPVFPHPDFEYTCDTIISSRASYVATRALQLLQVEATRRDLFLKRGHN